MFICHIYLGLLRDFWGEKLAGSRPFAQWWMKCSWHRALRLPMRGRYLQRESSVDRGMGLDSKPGYVVHVENHLYGLRWMAVIKQAIVLNYIDQSMILNDSKLRITNDDGFPLASITKNWPFRLHLCDPVNKWSLKDQQKEYAIPLSLSSFPQSESLSGLLMLFAPTQIILQNALHS